MQQEQNRRKTGERYESFAADYLVNHGLRIVDRNFRARRGEIDLIARDGEYLVFVEVKYRAGQRAGRGADAVSLRKQRTICRISDYYRVRFAYGEDTPVRYDVVECMAAEGGMMRINWYRNAFPYVR